MVDKRRTIDLLPGYIQSDTLKKAFEATVDHLFQPESVEFITGYVGSRPTWFNPDKDYYVTEPTKNRRDYQLSPTIVSKSYQTGRITNAMFYEDLLGQLRFQGALVDNPDRLFSQEYYSWSPPIDLDKFVNFTNYYWLPDGPDGIELLETTDLLNEVGEEKTYTYKGTVRYTSTGEIDTVDLTFTSGMKIIPTQDLTLELNQKSLIVEGVGRSISFFEIPRSISPGWDLVSWDGSSWDGNDSISDKLYVTISRASSDGNQWSESNRWFHVDVLEQSRTTGDDRYAIRARRPIVEFDPNIRLWNYGFRNRGTVDLTVSTGGDFLSQCVGQPEFYIDQVPLRDGMRILVISDEISGTQGRIYTVNGQSAGSIELTLEGNGTLGGIPVVGDRAQVRFGSLQGKNVYFDGNSWISTGQQRFGISPPLFDVFDIDGVSLGDAQFYPGNNFAGSKVFSYTLDPNQAIDQELGINAKLDQFGDYVFTNDLAVDSTTYTRDGRITAHVGYAFALVGDQYVNSWYRAPDPSRQYIVNEFFGNGVDYSFVIDQDPASSALDHLPTLFVTTITTDGTATTLREGTDYTISGKVITLVELPGPDIRIVVRSWSEAPPDVITGFYELPKNLTANPNNQTIVNVSRSQFLQQFTQIIDNQTGIKGSAIGVNNYRDTSQVKGLGLSILQHRGPMLKLGVINSVGINDVTRTESPTDAMMAMGFAQRSYQRFYNRFLQTLFNISRKNSAPAADDPTTCDPYLINQWVSMALRQINIGKTVGSPWANSGPGNLPGQYCSTESTDPTYVPASPARLGITSVYRPMVYFDSSYDTPRMVIQTHDGSRIVMVDDRGDQLGGMVHGELITTNPEELTNPVAAAWLQFEINLYNSLPERYRSTDASLVFDIREQVPGKWRSSDYTRNEFISLTRPFFDKWTVINQIRFSPNTGYQTDNEFSYNYRSVLDRDGGPVPGHWQGIYRWFYDTDRPHTHPWEMLGFSQKPSWWNEEYGSAPYTSGNTALWEDLRDGMIRRGDRAGQHQAWSRPGLLSCIPVDDQGTLLPPYQAGCVASLPDVYSSKSEWIYGDGSPVETAWICSQDWPFVLAQSGYLMKPARFVEYTWDTLRTKEIYQGTDWSQWIYLDTDSRRSSNQFYVHREKPSSLTTGVTVPNETNLSYFGSCGWQHWISEYLISQGLDVTEYFGNLIRGGDVQLAHRMAGYIAADSLRVTVDSFGDLGYSSQVVPAENINTHLYRSTSIGESIYSGVVVQQLKDGWRVSGFDQISQTFRVIPSNPTGVRTSVVIGNQRVVEYKTPLAQVDVIRYGTVFTTRQQVYDFLIGYGRWLETQGWVFDEYNEDANSILDWSHSAKEYLFWSQGTWENGTFLALSPGASSMKCRHAFGNIQYVNGIVSGAYPIVDRSGAPIQPQNVSIIREQDSMTVRPTNGQGIFALRLYRTTLEHAIFLDNLTGFGDVIYQPLYDLKQDRIKIYCYRANGWNGRVDAPGYIITQNVNTNTWTMTSNFESTVTDFQKYFNIEQPKNFLEIDRNTGGVIENTSRTGTVARSDISNLSKHLIGYQARDYLQNLLLEDSTQFEFYQGFVRQKGTRSTIDRLLRNTSIVPENSTFEYYEEWLIRLGQYGATSLNNLIEYKIPQDKVISDPQWVRLFSDADSDFSGDDVLSIVPRDPLIVVPPESYQDRLFKTRTSYSIDPTTDLPTAGYPQLGETTWMVRDKAALLSLYTTQRSTFNPLKNQDTIWQFITDTGSWTVWILNTAITSISTTYPSMMSGQPTTIGTVSEHGLIDGDICVMYGVTGVPQIDGTYVISGVTPTTFQIPVTTFESGYGGTILVYRPMRFRNLFSRNSGEPPQGWKDGDLVYVDEGGIEPGAWTVYRRVDGDWVPYRQQEHRIDASLLLESKLYNSQTKELLSLMDYHDPIQGRINGKADAEISFKLDYDPAKYTNGPYGDYAVSESEAWSSAQLGQIWWDLSAVRYIDYGQGDDRYRIQHWGKIAPGTSINVYEWVRSPIPPSDWASYVAEGKSITENGRSYTPSGKIRNPADPSWTEGVEIGPGGTQTTVYYFWVCNSAMPPSASWRTLTTQNIATLIADPSQDDGPWYAAISQRSIIIGNVQRLLNSDKVVQQIIYSASPNESNNYGEWELIREGDRMSPISDLAWNRLKSSLTTADGLGNDVPDYHLNVLQRYGNLIRPRQTWFVNREAASKVFIDTFNVLMASRSTPMITDPSATGWQLYFEAAEPAPPQAGNWDYHVADLQQRDDLIGAIVPGQVVLVDPISINDNLWTMYRYQLGNDPWVLIRSQAYNTSNYWKYVDWYLTGYGSNSVVTYSLDTLADLDGVSNPKTGQIAKVLNSGDGTWQMFSWSRSWVLVGQERGSIEVLSSIYDWQTGLGSFDQSPFDSVSFDKTASVELGYVIDGIKDSIYSSSDNIEINTLFFAMLFYVVSEQGQVDWLIKTSDIILKGFDQPLLQTQILAPDNIQSIIGFINEAKPYHVKIREFVSGKSLLDTANVANVDFDRPPMYSDADVPPSTTPSDPSQRSYLETYRSWYDNYLTNPELVRTLKTTMIFDRISTPDLVGGWGRTWDVLGWSPSYGQNFGAMDRIYQYYQPTPGMIPMVIEDLIGGAGYRSMIIDALGLGVDTGWGRGPWGGLIGWDADSSMIEAYLDQIIQGGVIPRYDSGIGNGITRTFPVLSDITNPRNVVVWSDGQLRTYGVDYVIPTFIQGLEIVDGGSGYNVGDQLDLIAGTGLAPSRLRVTAVTTGGQVAGLEILGRGSYRTVTPGPYMTRYPASYPGLGAGLVVIANWACKDVEFTVAPASSDVPNIYMLYIGETFAPAPSDLDDTIYKGNEFVQPWVDQNHPEELFMTKVRDSLMMDVAVAKTGGRPLVIRRVYLTDGLLDQYDLTITPQNNDAVMAYLDGIPLINGIDGDYLINYDTNRLVMINTPLPGSKLDIMVMGTGGASREISEVYVVDPGRGYLPNDLIVFAIDIGQVPASVRISSVKAVSARIDDPGLGYRMGDLLILGESTGTPLPGTSTVLRVTQVGLDGVILAVEILNPGGWSSIPTTLQWNLDRTPGTGYQQAQISISWGANTAVVQSIGRYARIPSQPMVQSSPPASGGTGSSWSALFTGEQDTYRFVGNGTRTDFFFPIPITTISEQLLITVDGVVQFGVQMLTGGIRLQSPPAYGSRVIITIYQTMEYSKIVETSISVLDQNVLTYPIDSFPATTAPSYLSSLVRVNGQLVNPPDMQQLVGNGVVERFQLTIDLTGAISTSVYVDQILKIEDVDYEILGNEIVFSTPPGMNSDIQLICIKATTRYSITGPISGYPTGSITFAPGVLSANDQILVTTYNQDLDYEFHSESFDTPVSGPGLYRLTKSPFDKSTISVWQDGTLLVPGVDYTVEVEAQSNAGWSLFGWDTSPWELGIDEKTTVRVSERIGSTVIINYMTGLPGRPAVSWRTQTAGDQSISICLSDRRTITLTNVYSYSPSIEIDDYTKISHPGPNELGFVYINSELISFSDMHLAPTPSNPNRAILVGLQRNRMGTSGNPRTEYNIQFFDGDGATKYFPTEAAGQAIAETVYVDDGIQIEGVDYEFVINPPNIPAGRYVHFLNDAPVFGYRNVKIMSLNRDSINTNISHVILSTVVDAGTGARFPRPYNWEPTPLGIQYSRTNQSNFIMNQFLNG